MNPETRFSRSLRKKFDAGHNIRVENPACPGTPDINDCIDGIEFWVETKRVKELPKKPETPVFPGVMRAEQKLWLTMRSRAKGRCFIAALVEKENLVFIVPGSYAYVFESMTLDQLNKVKVTMESMWAKP